MLKTKLLHPEILQALGSNGHGAKVLISDGNYPASTGVPVTAKKVFLNLAPGMLSVVDVLSVVSQAIPVESATVMVPPYESEQTIHSEYTEILETEVPLKKLKRFDFYEDAKSPDTFLAIASGETRRFANIFLTIRVVK